MDSHERLHALHRTLAARRRPVSTQQLMDELDCSRSTLHRTVVRLRDTFGAPIINATGRGYFYDRSAGSFELPGLWFRADELEALLVMDDLLETVQPGVLHTQFGPLRNKVRQLLDDAIQGREPFPTHRIRILRSHARQVPTPNLTAVASAVVERRRLAFRYAGRVAGETTHRHVAPQRLVYYRDQWYLDACDEGKNALRTFSIDRMSNIKALDGTARDVADEELDALLTAGYGLFAGPAKHKARLVFTAERARWVADESWHPDQTGRFLPDARYELTVPYADERELVGEILRHGPDVEVLGPESLIEVFRDRLKRAARKYEPQ
ncbi:MAG: YafY family protein [Gammaproteobacteria bacterium]|nr:YafY family protein [Gammaproteobacteria bacterium]